MGHGLVDVPFVHGHDAQVGQRGGLLLIRSPLWRAASSNCSAIATGQPISPAPTTPEGVAPAAVALPRLPRRPDDQEESVGDPPAPVQFGPAGADHVLVQCRRLVLRPRQDEVGLPLAATLHGLPVGQDPGLARRRPRSASSPACRGSRRRSSAGPGSRSRVSSRSPLRPRSPRGARSPPAPSTGTRRRDPPAARTRSGHPLEPARKGRPPQGPSFASPVPWSDLPRVLTSRPSVPEESWILAMTSLGWILHAIPAGRQTGSSPALLCV